MDFHKHSRAESDIAAQRKYLRIEAVGLSDRIGVLDGPRSTMFQLSPNVK